MRLLYQLCGFGTVLPKLREGELDMNARKLSWACTVVVITAVAGCGDKNPAQPTGTGSVTAPRQPQPATSATFRYVDQPITLTVDNAAVTQQTGTTYTFEVASDAGFVNKVQTRNDVAEGTGGRTSVRLDTLAGGSDDLTYFENGCLTRARKRPTSTASTSPRGNTSKCTWSLMNTNATRSKTASSQAASIERASCARHTSLVKSGNWR